MKTIIKSCAFALGLGALTTGCADFVNILPKDMVTEDNFWNEKGDVDQMVTGIYAKMQSDAMMRRYIIWGEVRSDNVYVGNETMSKDRNLYEFLRENIKSSNPYTAWVDFYNIINSCNQIIERAPKVAGQDPTYTESNVNATIAEVTAIRSLCYFYLIRTFQDVPFYRHSVQTEDQVKNLPVTPFDEVLAELIYDCESVLNNALKAYVDDGANTGRVTQNTIHALLTDMYLWNGDYQQACNHANAVISFLCNRYEEAKNSNLKMIASNDDKGVRYPAAYGNKDHLYVGYPMYEDQYSTTGIYGRAFNTIFSQSGRSEETIFELYFEPTTNPTYLPNSAVGFMYGNGIADKNKGGNDGHGVLAPALQIIEMVKQSDTNPFFHKADARFWECISCDKECTEGWITKYTSSSNNVDPTQNMNTTPRYSQDLSYNWIFYRLTDVMSMKAEALIEMMPDNVPSADNASESDLKLIAYNDSLRTEAFNILWTIHHRSTMQPVYDLKSSNYLTKGAMRELCLSERQKELMFEGKRWFDLVRMAVRSGSVSALANKVRPKLQGLGSNVLPNLESLFLPYNKEEVRINPLIEQKPYWASLEGAETTESTAN